MQKLETQFFFSITSKNNIYVFSIYTRYRGLLLHVGIDVRGGSQGNQNQYVTM